MKRPRARTIAQKILLSYGILALFTAAALAVAVNGLSRVGLVAEEIASQNLVSLTALLDLRETLRDQTAYAAKFRILHSGEFRSLFLERDHRFLQQLNRLRETAGAEEVAPLAAQYERFRSRILGEMEGRAPAGDLESAVAAVSARLDALREAEQQRLQGLLDDARLRRRETVHLAIFLCCGGFFAGALVTGIFLLRISRNMEKLIGATNRIAEGDFDCDPKIPPTDDLGELSRDFVAMAEKLKELEQMSLDASPLTRLPGNIALERALLRRLRESEPFALCYTDLDNFKPFADRYGYAWGSDVIRLTGDIIDETVRREGGTDTFIGHVGGDDFVILLHPERAVPVCEGVISSFSSRMPGLYPEEDRLAGFMRGTDRYGVERNFPLVTISLAVLDCRPGDYATPAEIAAAVAALKEQVKEQPGSNYVIRRREP